MPKYVPLLLLLVFFALALNGQPHYFRHFQADQGLSHNSVNCIIQDRMGFVWIGTKGGLDRFDGNDFKNIVLDPQKAGANNVTSLHEDHEGTIWVGTASGLYRFDPDAERCEQIQQVPGVRVGDIRETPAKRVRLIVGWHLDRYDRRTSHVIGLNVRASAIEIDEDGGIWIGGPQGVVKKMDANTNQAVPFMQIGAPVESRGLVTCMASAAQSLIVGTTKGL